MRLKEKLAQDLVKELDFSSQKSGQHAEWLYLSGFQKAKELIRKDITEWLRRAGEIPENGLHYHELIGITLDTGEQDT